MSINKFGIDNIMITIYKGTEYVSNDTVTLSKESSSIGDNSIQLEYDEINKAIELLNKAKENMISHRKDGI